MEHGNTVTATGGNNVGRIGILTHIEKHPGSFDIAHVRDSKNHIFATRLSNIFSIGTGKKPEITIPKNKGIRLTTIEERDTRMAKQKHYQE